MPVPNFSFLFIHRTLGPRLDVGDFKTMCESIKYLALKNEVMTPGGDQMLFLTDAGQEYVNEGIMIKYPIIFLMIFLSLGEVCQQEW